LFLPTEQAIQSSIKDNLFSTTNTTKNQLLYHILKEGGYDINSLISKRHYFDTLSSQSPIIITNPVSVSNSTSSSAAVQVLAGPSIANISAQNYYQCTNG
jgi:hypothetical protein